MNNPPGPAPEHLHTLDDAMWQALFTFASPERAAYSPMAAIGLCKLGLLEIDWNVEPNAVFPDGLTISPEGQRHLDAVQELARKRCVQKWARWERNTGEGPMPSCCDDMGKATFAALFRWDDDEQCFDATPLGRATLRAIREEMDRG